MSGKCRVLVVDDSALVRNLLKEIINRQADMECVGAANDALAAREMIRDLNPDVVTLDVEMPHMDGIDFLGRLMRLRPMPVLMISTLTEHGADVTMRALELGAVDFVAKPRLGIENGLLELAQQIVEKIRVAAQAKVKRLPSLSLESGRRLRAIRTPERERPLQNTQPLRIASSLLSDKLICIGASTGGTEAVREVLACMPSDAPPVVIVQHMPAGFTASFAARLNELSTVTVTEAMHGEPLLPGHAYIAPGGKHFAVARRVGRYVASIFDGETVNRHKPSVDVLFRSAAAAAGPNAIGIMLTGMGSDGASAMRVMKEAGSYNFAQDQATCVVFGMPREAIAHGAVDAVLPLPQIGPAVLARLLKSVGPGPLLDEPPY
ncbi:protein-glutamate methylesterase/protein-glutamine glutaminase [Diaphorobacter caeni]|uniref:protein-glutamate methylesterase/protein-glutamine glutaminase n=1 Tax=Diaphorobacter caeni TaxID=2784387 RepID=UPI00188F49D1|nr:chemotaxis response regulator protein-glutamate methylesterase [Diaphorobacter caeni]MBF5007510.1 chemotaxis response regulator protein-glutamate methylesterase [Diaphorobacter caeni]